MYLVKKGVAPSQAHVDIPEGLCEEEHGRQGFAGPVSHLYRKHPPTGWVRIEGPLRPRAFACAALSTPTARSKDGSPLELLRSSDVRVFLSRPAESMPYFVRNADGDELYFVHDGRGSFETEYGMLPFAPGDYILIPKGTTYRILLDGAQAALLLIAELPVPITLPERGPLGQHALFDRGVLAVPEPPSEQGRHVDGQEWEVRIKRDGQHTRVVYPFYPMDVAGWKGDLWPTRLNVRDIRPVVSPGYHLPPSVHVTFTAGGALISTFVPRPLESDPKALRVPFYHRNMDYDELLFYHSGSFFSRSGIEPGMMTLHPQGIHHGPQPSAVEASRTKLSTDEIAVMIESSQPFVVLPELEPVELKDYAMSWSTR
jgi:homogentisate 1,2-dioxygenase